MNTQNWQSTVTAKKLQFTTLVEESFPVGFFKFQKEIYCHTLKLDACEYHFLRSIQEKMEHFDGRGTATAPALFRVTSADTKADLVKIIEGIKRKSLVTLNRGIDYFGSLVPELKERKRFSSIVRSTFPTIPTPKFGSQHEEDRSVFASGCVNLESDKSLEAGNLNPSQRHGPLRRDTYGSSCATVSIWP